MHPLQPAQGSIPIHHRPNHQSDSPHQHYPSPNVTKQRLSRQQQSPYPQVGIAPNGQPSPESFYTGSPYTTHGMPTASPQYSSAETSEMMAAAQMQPRQYHLYTPQSSSPVSAVSSHGQDQPTRLYSQPPQIQPSMYYPAYGIPPHQMMTPPQSTVPQHQSQSQVPHSQGSMQAPAMNHTPHPQPKFESNTPRPLDTSNLKSPATQITSNQNIPKNPPTNGHTTSPNQGGQAGNSSAAPGPIPATTPLVVRQDHNGVQWIAFEYSRDRVKMEYTIRCDVESVNTNELDKEFKEANCVYPRAFCEKGQYSGNRLSYETECNTVGWSLVKLNPTLKEKRGLIQRAVDSWRNSNQDSRLRSRRVRRMNKQSTRAKNQQNSNPAPPRDSATPSSAMLQQRALPQGLNSSMTPSQMHHPRASTENSLPSNADSMVLNGQFDPHQTQQKPHPIQSPVQMRPANVFQGYPSAYPVQPHPGAVSMAPPIHNGLDAHLSNHHAPTISASNPIASSLLPNTTTQTDIFSPPSSPSGFAALYPRAKEKKFLTVAEPLGSNNRVRVKLDLKDVKMHEIPDDFMERNSVYPRSYFPRQMRLNTDEKRQKRVANRFSDLDVELAGELDFGSTNVRIPTLEGDSDAPVPRLGKRAGQREEMLNDSGYRISWEQVQKYDKRVLFLQRSLDAWRKRLNELQTSDELEPLSILPHQDLRVGKKAWLERRSPNRNPTTF